MKEPRNKARNRKKRRKKTFAQNVYVLTNSFIHFILPD
jgi:hypothetical protein